MGLAVVMTFSIAMTGCSSSDDGQTVGEAQEQTNKDNTKVTMKEKSIRLLLIFRTSNFGSSTNVGTTRYNG